VFFGFCVLPRMIEKNHFSVFAQGASTQTKRIAETKMLITTVLMQTMI
jgi:hypothetical protein